MKNHSKTLIRILLATFIALQSSYMPCLAEDAAATSVALVLTAKEVQLGSKLSKYVKGYEIFIENKGPNLINIDDIKVQNAMSGETAYNLYKNTNTGIGTMWIGASLLWWLFFIPPILAAIATPFMSAKNNKVNKLAWNESSQFPNQLEKTSLEAGEKISYKTILNPSDALSVEIAYTDTTNSESKRYKMDF